MRTQGIEVSYYHADKSDKKQYNVHITCKKLYGSGDYTKLVSDYSIMSRLLGLRTSYVKGLIAACNGDIIDREIYFTNLHDCKMFCTGISQISKVMRALLSEVKKK